MTPSEQERAVIREVRETEHDGRPARAVVLSGTIPAGVDEVWAAIARPERLAEWFLPVEGELKPGGRYRLEGNAHGTIERCERPEVLAVTWEYGESMSWVEVLLEPAGDGTRLTLVHTQAKDEQGEAHWAQYGAGATGIGWDLTLRSLACYLESGGEGFDRKTEEAWPTTEQGKAFVRASAAGWGEAEAASGGDADAARTRAERTASFYTGG